MRKTAKELQEQIDLDQKFKDHTASNDLRYAPMWVKVILVWAGTIFGGAILLALARTIIK
jgi:hypothetical protein